MNSGRAVVLVRRESKLTGSVSGVHKLNEKVQPFNFNLSCIEISNPQGGWKVTPCFFVLELQGTYTIQLKQNNVDERLFIVIGFLFCFSE